MIFTVWTPSKIESRDAKFDLSVSGQGIAEVRQVLCDDLVVCNAANYIDFAAHSIQFEVCEACLIEGCASGGRVAIRRINQTVLIIPEFEAMMKGDWEATEYAPPRWMVKRGPLTISRDAWGTFENACDGAPRFEAIPMARTSELLQIFHFQAPRSFLPDYLSLSQARWDLILCTSGHDSAIDLSNLRRLFSDPSSYEGHEICTPSPDSYIVSAFLDEPAVLEWPIFSSEPDPAVRLSDDLYFRPKLKQQRNDEPTARRSSAH